MAGQVRFVFCVHIHQPVLNFAAVFERIFDESYLPFLEVMERHASIKFCMHVSGVLYDWIQEHRPDYVVRLKRMVDAGRLELLGGGYYEPILTMLSPEDAAGQLEMMRDFMRKTFAVDPKGAWLAERVWEPHLASLLADAGVRYSVLDDSHFTAAGLSEAKLDGPFLTEDRGRLLHLFPLREALRYSIPFKDPAWTIRYLKEHARADGRAVVVYADDGEKFGAWPGTHKHVYEGGWLENFLRALEENADVIRTCTFSEALEAVPAVGRIYLPSCAYREMGEWSLLLDGQAPYRQLKKDLERSDQWPRAVSFVSGGQWRNFRVKYPEANLLYTRMLGISRRVNALGPRSAVRREARKALYRAQCNCPYWHGVFGGLYLSHLRTGAYSNLLAAERLIEAADKRSLRYPASRLEDYDLDGATELRLFNPSVNLFLSPRRGGQMFELDVRSRDLNLLATLARHREVYHDDLPGAEVVDASGETETIHGRPRALKEGLSVHLKYDPYLRGALVDHFFEVDAPLKAIESHEAERGDFIDRPYQLKVSRAGGRLQAVLNAEGVVGGLPVRLHKEVRIERAECAYQVEYVVENLADTPLATRFGIEFNVASLSPTEPGAFFHRGDGVSLGDLRTKDAWEVEREWWVRDTWHGLEVGWILTRPCRLVTYPIQTVSASERGFELTYQGTVVLPIWDLNLGPGETWNVVLTQRIIERGS